MALLGKGENRVLGSRFAINVLWALLGRGGAIGAGLVVMALMTRILSPSKMGIFYVAQSIVLLAGPLASFGLQQPTVRAIAAAKASGNLSEAKAFARASIRAIFLTSSSIAILYIVISGSVSQWTGPRIENRMSLNFLMAIWIVILAAESQLVAVLQGLEKIRDASVYEGTLGRLLLVPALLVTWIFFSHAELIIILLMFVGCEVVSVALAALKVRTLLSALGEPSSSGPTFGQLWKEAWPFLSQTMAGTIALRSGALILSAFRSHADVAVYGVATRLADMLLLPAAVINVPLAPSVARLHAQGERAKMQQLLQAAALWPTIIGVFVTGIWIIFGGSFLKRAFGSAYGSGDSILVVLSIGNCLISFLGPCALALAMTGEQRVVTLVGVIGLIVQLVLSVVLVKLYGAFGLALCLIGVALGMKFSWWIFARRRIGINTRANLVPFGHWIRDLRGLKWTLNLGPED